MSKQAWISAGVAAVWLLACTVVIGVFDLPVWAVNFGALEVTGLALLLIAVGRLVDWLEVRAFKRRLAKNPAIGKVRKVEVVDGQLIVDAEINEEWAGLARRMEDK